MVTVNVEVENGELVVIEKRIRLNSNSMELCEFLDRRHHATDRYQPTHPFLHAWLQGEETRTKQLKLEGSKQMEYPKSSDGWWVTLKLIEGRALWSVFWVWCVVVGHSILYSCLHDLYLDDRYDTIELSSWEVFFGISLNATLGLLLVFRLNRAATRWWLSRQFWGILIAKTRTVTCGLLTHGHHDPIHRNEAVRWVAAYALSVMEFLRGCEILNIQLFAGILTSEQVQCLQEKRHPPLYAADQIRYYMRKVFEVTEDTLPALGMARSQQLSTLESEWTTLLDQCGGMERIKATPLPVVYVSHLRTFLLFSLFLYPYVWGYKWGWSTIPITAVSAFCLLGIEAASVEVEQPFQKERVNALNMDGFCIGALSNIQQLLCQHADRELKFGVESQRTYKRKGTIEEEADGLISKTK